MKTVEKKIQCFLLCNFSFLFYVNIIPFLRRGGGRETQSVKIEFIFS